MIDLDRTFREADQIPVTDLWPGIVSRTPDQPPSTSPGRRVTAIALALIIAVLGVGLVLRALSRGIEQPAAPSITPQNVASLHQIAFNATRGIGFRFATGDGVLVMGTLEDARNGWSNVVTYPYPCGGSGPACAPLWQAASVKGSIPIPAVADGVVYVSGWGDHTLSAFPASCGTGGATCQPLWTAGRDGGFDEPPLVVGNRVFVATSEDVRSYAVGCGSRGQSCDPIWSAPLSGYGYLGYVLVWDPQTETLFVGEGRRIVPFDCGSASRCTRGRSQRIGLVADLAVDGGTLFVGGDSHVKAFDIACLISSERCGSLWASDQTAFQTSLTLADGIVYAYDRYGWVYAFPETCAADGSNCSPIWTSRPRHVRSASPADAFARPVVSGGVVFAEGQGGNLFAFPVDCRGVCQPLWSHQFGRAEKPFTWEGAFDARVLADHLYTASHDGLHVFAPDENSSQATSTAG
jgi:hypothetical protein